MAKTRDARLNLRVPGSLLKRFKTNAKRRNTTVTQRIVDFMMSEVRKDSGEIRGKAKRSPVTRR